MPEFTIKDSITGETITIAPRLATKNQDYTFILADIEKIFIHSSDSNHIWTIPPQSSIDWPNAARIHITKNGGLGTLQIARGTGVALYTAGTNNDSNITLAASSRYSTHIFKISDNVWILEEDSSVTLDSELSALAGLISAADKLPYFTGSGTASLADFTAFARTILDDATAAAVLTTLGAGTGNSPQFTAIELGHASDTTLARVSAGVVSIEGSNILLVSGLGSITQAYDATLQSLAALGTAADKMSYTTGVDTWAETAITSFGRSILDDANESTFKATVNLEIGTDVQAYSAVLANTTASFLTADETKLDYITITQAVDLDAMEAALVGAFVLKGGWDASAGTFPGGGNVTAGWQYSVTVGGTVNSVVFSAGDLLLCLRTDVANANSSTTTYALNWQKLATGSTVTSIAGNTGAVTLDQLNLEVGVDLQAYDADLAALAANSTNGLWTHTGAGTGQARTITGTASEITVTNGDGVSGNPTISIPDSPVFISPLLGTPTSGVMTNMTGLPASGVIAGTFTAGTYSFSGSTISNLGTVTTADINGGTLDGVVIGGASAAAITGTTIGGTVVSASTAFRAADGTKDAPGYSFTNDTNTGFWLDSETALTQSATINVSINGLGTAYALEFAAWATGDTDITGLTGGSVTGGAILAPGTQPAAGGAHFAVLLRDNDVGDSFVVLSGGGNWNTDATWDTNVLQAKASGAVIVHSDITLDTGSITSASGAISFGNENLSTTGTLAIGASSVNWIHNLFAGDFTSGGGSTTASKMQISGTLTGASGDTALLSSLYVSTNITTQTAADVITDVASVIFDEPDITVGAGSSITNASTVTITGAPTEGTNNYALLVKSGAVRFAGTSNLVGVTTHGGNVVSDTDSTDDLGTTSVRWANVYTDSIGDSGQALTLKSTTLTLNAATTVSGTFSSLGNFTPPPTGAGSRTILGRLMGEMVTPYDFLALGDNSADGTADTTAFTAAFAWCSGLGGQVRLHIPEGSYVLNSRLTATGSFDITCDKTATMRWATAGAANCGILFEFDAASNTLNDVCLPQLYSPAINSSFAIPGYSSPSYNYDLTTRVGAAVEIQGGNRANYYVHNAQGWTTAIYARATASSALANINIAYNTIDFCTRGVAIDSGTSAHGNGVTEIKIRGNTNWAKYPLYFESTYNWIHALTHDLQSAFVNEDGGCIVYAEGVKLSSSTINVEYGHAGESSDSVPATPVVLNLTGSVTVVTGETLTQAVSSATGVVVTGGTGTQFCVRTVSGTFNTSNQLTGSTSGALGANSVPTSVRGLVSPYVGGNQTSNSLTYDGEPTATVGYFGGKHCEINIGTVYNHPADSNANGSSPIPSNLDGTIRVRSVGDGTTVRIKHTDRESSLTDAAIALSSSAVETAFNSGTGGAPYAKAVYCSAAVNLAAGAETTMYMYHQCVNFEGITPVMVVPKNEVIHDNHLGVTAFASTAANRQVNVHIKNNHPSATYNDTFYFWIVLP